MIKLYKRENELVTKRQRAPQIFSLAAAVVLVVVTCLHAASEERNLCADILYLIEQSRSQFSAIRGETDSDSGGYDTTFILTDAWHCLIHEDVKKSSYRCTWKFPYGDDQAHATFHRFAEEMRSCIGNMAEEREDQLVNHPDYYASYYYHLPGSEASVSLKNKGKLMSTLVSIRVDGYTEMK